MSSSRRTMWVPLTNYWLPWDTPLKPLHIPRSLLLLLMAFPFVLHTYFSFYKAVFLLSTFLTVSPFWSCFSANLSSSLHHPLLHQPPLSLHLICLLLSLVVLSRQGSAERGLCSAGQMWASPTWLWMARSTKELGGGSSDHLPYCHNSIMCEGFLIFIFI